MDDSFWQIIIKIIFQVYEVVVEDPNDMFQMRRQLASRMAIDRSDSVKAETIVDAFFIGSSQLNEDLLKHGLKRSNER